MMYSEKFKDSIRSSISEKKHVMFPEVNFSEFGVNSMISHFDFIDNRYIENWGFISENKANSTFQTYMNNQSCLKKFLFLFKYEARNIINNFEQKRLFYPGINLSNSANKYTQTKSKIIIPKKWIVKIDGKDVNFSSRQFQSLIGLARGYSQQDLALKMKVSKRTVETYINQIKSKLGLDTKSQIVNFANNSCEFSNIDFEKL